MSFLERRKRKKVNFLTQIMIVISIHIYGIMRQVKEVKMINRFRYMALINYIDSMNING